MIEIYNEQVRHLLVSHGSNNNVADALLVPVTCSQDVLDLMRIGQKNRGVGATGLNERSTRCHRPFFGDQGVAGRLIEDVWEIGVVMEGKVFTKNGLLKSLNLILAQEEGKKIRDNALKVKQTVQDATRPEGQATRDLKTLIEIISTTS
ncbi:Anthocyanidin 3-O-glucosyltransferase 2 [Glycine soja]|uniref:Anthocyanidin 3-O-glucosyltransferase 2 n=1 Tax=Glycine soja TaxID=3848 RepID=A0A0B2P9K5_GLYSO|nr:Anthocyanidin 3-O-glucosyltransferase 2 [Glycine soja]